MSDTGDGDGFTKPTDLFDRWLAHHEGRPYEEPVVDEPAEVVAEAVAPVEVAVMSPDPEVEVEAEPPAEAVPEPARERAHEPEPAADLAVPSPAEALPHTIFFKPRTGTRRLLGAILLVTLATTVAAAAWAWQDRSYLSYGIAGTAAALTLIVWATRASASAARLTLHGSELEIMRGGSRSLFDLAQSYTPIEVQGRPGERRWRVLFLRRGMSAYVIDASMVDPHEFMKVLRYFRPESGDHLA
jgi:hypothetical protein